MNKTEHTIGGSDAFAADGAEPMLRDEAPSRADEPMFDEPAPVAPPPPADEEGVIRTPAQLKAAREARGLSLVEVANRLRFYPRQMQALEEGAWQDLPGMAFVRAALRSYARLLDVDVSPLLESLGGYAQPAEIRPTSTLAEPMPRSGGSLLFGGGGDLRRWMPWIVLALLAVVALAFFFGGGAELTGMRSLVSSEPEATSRTVEVPVPAGSEAEASSASGAGSAAGLGAGGAERSGSGAVSGAAGTAGTASSAGAGSGSGATPPSAVAGSQGAQRAADASGAAADAGADRDEDPGSAGTERPGAQKPQAGAADEGGSVRLRAAVSLGVAGAGKGPDGAGGSGSGRGDASAPGTAAATGAAAATGTQAAAGGGASVSVGAGSAAGSSGGLRITSNREAWVQVKQEDGKVLFTGIVQPDAPAELQGTPPYRLTIGRASSVQLSYRGIPVDLRPYTRDDVARLEVR